MTDPVDPTPAPAPSKKVAKKTVSKTVKKPTAKKATTKKIATKKATAKKSLPSPASPQGPELPFPEPMLPEASVPVVQTSVDTVESTQTADIPPPERTPVEKPKTVRTRKITTAKKAKTAIPEAGDSIPVSPPHEESVHTEAGSLSPSEAPVSNTSVPVETTPEQAESKPLRRDRGPVPRPRPREEVEATEKAEEAIAEKNEPEEEPVFGEGIVEISGKGFGFLREAKRQFQQSPQDIFVTPEMVRNFGLRDGLMLYGRIKNARRGPQMVELLKINGENPEKYKNLPHFEELTALNPIERISLETTPDRFTTRVMDMMTPVGKGQRGLIVAPPRTGKTTMLEHIAEAVARNHPKMKLIILLVDERPEEVTAIRRSVPEAELMASSNDADVKNHTRIAQLAIERARRWVEAGEDVFMLLDSLTRLGRAFNNATTGKGRTLSGGMDARGMEIPRRLFSAARNTIEAGSLTIIATALIETGSRMDDLIFQEFKGTGNMEVVLDRRISDQRVYPAIDIFLSGTRREELLLPIDQLEKISIIRRGLSGHKPIEAIERLLSFLHKFPTNAEMLKSIPAQ